MIPVLIIALTVVRFCLYEVVYQKTNRYENKEKKEKSNITNLFFQKRNKSSPGAVQKSHFIQPLLILLGVFSSIKNYPVLQSKI